MQLDYNSNRKKQLNNIYNINNVNQTTIFKCKERLYDGLNINNVYDQNNNQITDLAKFYNLIEHIFNEILEVLVRTSMDNITTSLQIPYVIVGGKAINNIIKNNSLEKSFDFDIHITDNINTNYKATTNDIYVLGNAVVENLNKLLDNSILNIFTIYRNYIINLLKKYNLINKNQENFYLNEKLFYYGERIKNTGVTINGIFIHFKFRDDIFGNDKYSNSYDSNTTDNEIYYPFSDMDLENIINFGIIINDNKFTIDSYDGLRYASYSVLLSNLISYTTERPGYKVDNNIRKIKAFLDIKNYKCQFIQKNKNNSDQLNTKNLKYSNNTNIIENITGADIKLNNVQLLENGNSKKKSIDLIIDNYNKQHDMQLNNCVQNLVLIHDYTPNSNIIWNTFLNNFNENTFSTQLETLLKNNDVSKNVLNYTGSLYGTINDYCQYTHFNLNVDNLLQPNNLTNNDMINITDDISSIIYKTNTSYGPFLNNFKDEFILFRAQNFICFNSPNGDIFNPGSVKIGDIIYIPYYQSTSYSTNFSFSNFVRNNTFFFRIKINKNSKKWIFVNKYSQYPEEKEIILDKNVCLYVTGIQYSPIKLFDNNIRDVMFVDVTLFDTFNDITNANLINQPNHNLINFNENNIPEYIKENNNHFRGSNTNLSQNNVNINITNQNFLLYDNTNLLKRLQPCQLKLEFQLYTEMYNLLKHNNTINSNNHIYTFSLNNNKNNDNNNNNQKPVKPNNLLPKLLPNLQFGGKKYKFYKLN